MYFITGNKNKLREANAILGEVTEYDVDLPEIQSLDSHEIIEEKLKEAMKHKKGEFIVEDTSLYINCLNGLPGPLIKWFMKTIGNEGIWKILEGYEDKTASAKTCIGYSDEKGVIKYFEGVIEGEIVAPRGDTTFGWDPIFMPRGHTKTFAEMDEEEKNSLSMRKLALEALREHLTSSQN